MEFIDKKVDVDCNIHFGLNYAAFVHLIGADISQARQEYQTAQTVLNKLIGETLKLLRKKSDGKNSAAVL
uniref:Uncharacterized protein n=1 Tax=Panagrolaimus sp. ES5 TaxID=591445 RepID=A0AC34GST7_9BILA